MYMNEKFILKFEIGPYEQIYKFTKEMAVDVEAVKKICDDAFMENVLAQFDKMHEILKSRFWNLWIFALDSTSKCSFTNVNSAFSVSAV